jgi:hypothetical protein
VSRHSHSVAAVIGRPAHKKLLVIQELARRAGRSRGQQTTAQDHGVAPSHSPSMRPWRRRCRPPPSWRPGPSQLRRLELGASGLLLFWAVADGLFSFVTTPHDAKAW